MSKCARASGASEKQKNAVFVTSPAEKAGLWSLELESQLHHSVNNWEQHFPSLGLGGPIWKMGAMIIPPHPDSRNGGLTTNNDKTDTACAHLLWV